MRTINIFATDNEDGQEWAHKDWYYKLTEVVEGVDKRIGKLYRSRSAASRAARKLGKVVHWYPI